MIKSLTLHNFESHRYSSLSFAEGVNIICGSSDSGKTALLRALRWCLINRPLGDDIVSWKGVSDGKETSVQLITSTDTITRSKGKQEEYKLNTTEFHAFNKEVPQEILQALNIDDTNFKTQFESHFLLSSTAGEVAQHFNKVARLDKIDLSTANLNKWITGIKQTITFKNGEIVKNQEKLLSYDYLVTFEKEIILLEADDKALTLQQTKRLLLHDVITTLEDINGDIEREQAILTIEPLLDSLLKSIAERKEAIIKADKLDIFINDILQVQKDLDEYEVILSVESLVVDLLKLHADKKESETKRVGLRRIVNSITNTNTQLELAEVKYKKLHKQFEDEFPEICPLCNKPK
jgi:predicted ATP-dependent endonuclease of OLD family